MSEHVIFGTFIAAGGYDWDDDNRAIAESYADLIAYDLVLPGAHVHSRPSLSYHGYTDYPFLDS
ncbi:unnamed protein product [Spirodela intermedia]|uniref:Uncharacterized protein n=1 Tax=Spirodela intermedia TaxID=51605 RepID=A0A7I8ITE5_SPIIN|nr:unnamed protein product [Spirodela intermedia]CAA6660224.1 unnamed protein product [Spirodela intermedia]